MYAKLQRQYLWWMVLFTMPEEALQGLGCTACNITIVLVRGLQSLTVSEIPEVNVTCQSEDLALYFWLVPVSYHL